MATQRPSPWHPSIPRSAFRVLRSAFPSVIPHGDATAVAMAPKHSPFPVPRSAFRVPRSAFSVRRSPPSSRMATQRPSPWHASERGAASIRVGRGSGARRAYAFHAPARSRSRVSRSGALARVTRRRGARRPGAGWGCRTRTDTGPGPGSGTGPPAPRGWRPSGCR